LADGGDNRGLPAARQAQVDRQTQKLTVLLCFDERRRGAVAAAALAHGFGNGDDATND
jgi:hypothetical protein